MKCTDCINGKIKFGCIIYGNVVNPKDDCKCDDFEHRPQNIPAEDRYGREPDKVKPLAKYLDEYIEHEAELRNVEPPAAYMYAYNSWHELLEQALDAYESTQGVRIRIERV